MCGIFGIFSNKLVTKPILDGLTKLEYRGYDSSGISILDNNKKIHTLRAKGKLKNLINKVNKNFPSGYVGIGHTRWATLVFRQRLMLIHIHQKVFQLSIMESLKIILI